MANYLFVYHGGNKPSSPEEVAGVMEKWGAWFGSMGDAVVDGGAPVGMPKTISAGSVADDGGANPASGYSVISANDMDDAITKAQGCPILEHGGSVEIAEAIQM